MMSKKHRDNTKKRVMGALALAVVAASIICIVCLVCGRTHKVHITGSSVTYYIDNEEYVFNSEPYICDMEVYLPVADILSSYGYTCTWNDDTQTLVISDEKKSTDMAVDKNTLVTNGKSYEFKLPVMKMSGVVYMPSEMFNHFSDDELVMAGEFKYVERPHRDLLEDTYIDDTYRMSGSVSRYNGVYVVDNKAAMELLYYPEDNCKGYAQVINNIAEALPEVNIFNIVIPTITEFYGPEEIYTDQISGIRTIYENLDESVMPVNVIKEMWPHADEHLYFTTDHHWTQRGAYYAYKAFIKLKCEEIADINEFPQDNVENFVGSWIYSLKGTPGESALTSNKETMERFMPIVDYTGEVYLDMYLKNKWRDTKVIETDDDKYTTFLGGDMPIIKYTTSVKNGQKLVIIKESFGNAFATWAINNYEEVYVLDPRQWNGFNPQSDNGEFNLVKFYNEVCQFDDLIVISYPGSATLAMRNAISRLIGM